VKFAVFDNLLRPQVRAHNFSPDLVGPPPEDDESCRYIRRGPFTVNPLFPDIGVSFVLRDSAVASFCCALTPFSKDSRNSPLLHHFAFASHHGTHLSFLFKALPREGTFLLRSSDPPLGGPKPGPFRSRQGFLILDSPVLSSPPFIPRLLSLVPSFGFFNSLCPRGYVSRSPRV